MQKIKVVKMNKRLSVKVLEKLNRMHQNDQREINLSKTYRFSSNFEIERVWLKRLDGSKCDRKISRKINSTHQIKLRET